MRCSLKTGAGALWRAGGTLVAACLFWVCGCGSSEAEFQDIIQARTGAVAALKSQGAKVTEKKMPRVGTMHLVDMSGAKEISDKTFELLKQSGLIVMELNLSGTNVADSHLTRLNEKELSGGLARLNLSDTEISDKGLENITAMTFLGDLNVENTKVTPEGVKAFLKAREANPLVTVKKTKVKQGARK